MKKTLVALAVVAASGASFAQVALTGTFSISKSSNLAGATGFEQSDGNMFIGVTEDLGGGTKLKLSSGFDFGGRNATGSEDTSMSVSGTFGAVTLKSYESHSAIEAVLMSGASLSNGVADSSAVDMKLTANRNGIIYTTPSFSGFVVNAVYVNGGKGLQTGAGQNSNKTVLSTKYSAGALTAYAEAVAFDNNYAGTSLYTGKALAGGSSYAAYGIYDAGVAKFGLGYNKNSFNDAGTTVVGVSVPVGAVTLGLDNTAFDGASWTTFGASYALSGRTSIKASYGNLNDAALANANKGTTPGGAAVGWVNTSQWRVGLFHSF